MYHINLNPLNSYQSLGHALGEVNRTMLTRPLAASSGFARTLLRHCFAKLLASLVGEPDVFGTGASRAQVTRRLRRGRISRATECDLKVVAAAVEIFADRLSDERFRRAEKAIHLVFVASEEIGNGLVTARVAAQRFVPVWIRHRPAVKHEATSVAGLVFRQPALVREGCDGDFHRFATFPFRLLPLDLSSVSIAMASSRRSCSLFGRYS